MDNDFSSCHNNYAGALAARMGGQPLLLEGREELGRSALCANAAWTNVRTSGKPSLDATGSRAGGESATDRRPAADESRRESF